MKRSLCILCGVLTALGALALRPAPAPDQVPTGAVVLAPNLTSANCKPSAPVRIDLDVRDLVGGRTQVEYTVTPIMDALHLDVSIVVPGAGVVTSESRPPVGAFQRGSVLDGSVSAEFPADVASAELEIQAHITIPDPEGIDGRGTYTTSQRITWGRVEQRPDNVTEVVIGDEVLLTVPATRL